MADVEVKSKKVTTVVLGSAMDAGAETPLASDQVVGVSGQC